jgi:hypothetical protein
MTSRVIDHGTWTETITELSDGGRLTVISHKDPEPLPAVTLPLAGGLGASLVGIMEADAVTDQAAENITTEWDRRWGIVT